MLERVLKLSIPTIYVWLCIFYCVFHCWLNILGELLRFGDRGFYREWWNATTIDQYWRLWNIPVHKWLARHVYFPMIRRGRAKPPAEAAAPFPSAGIPRHAVRQGSRPLRAPLQVRPHPGPLHDVLRLGGVPRAPHWRAVPHAAPLVLHWDHGPECAESPRCRILQSAPRSAAQQAVAREAADAGPPPAASPRSPAHLADQLDVADAQERPRGEHRLLAELLRLRAAHVHHPVLCAGPLGAAGVPWVHVFPRACLRGRSAQPQRAAK